MTAYSRDYYVRNRDRIRAQQADYQAEHGPVRNRIRQDRLRLKSYGITVEGFDAMADEQGGRCALCGGEQQPPTKRLCVDHDHETGLIRGLLCSRCNRGLGNLGDSVEGLQAAIDYLERSRV